MKRPTMTEIAQKAGVSLATVSRVLNGNLMVDESLKQKVLEAAKELSWTPIRSSNAVLVIGVVIPNISDAFFSRILDSIASEAERKNVRIMVFSCHQDPSVELRCLKNAASSHIDGLLYCPSTEHNSAELGSIFPENFPIVILYGRNVVPGLPHIYSDNIQGGYLAAKYLLSLGRRRIAFFASFWRSSQEFNTVNSIIELLGSTSQGIYSCLDRLEGYIKALDDAGVTVDENLLLQVPGFDFIAGEQAARKFLSRVCEFDAIICGNDQVAAGVISVLQNQGYTIPEMVSIIGYDDSAFALAARPQLTSIRQTPVLIGECAMEMILDRIEDKDVKDQKVVAELIVRYSTIIKQNLKSL
jgi:LacI family transcriptional regulator